MGVVVLADPGVQDPNSIAVLALYPKHQDAFAHPIHSATIAKLDMRSLAYLANAVGTSRQVASTPPEYFYKLSVLCWFVSSSTNIRV